LNLFALLGLLAHQIGWRDGLFLTIAHGTPR
jgi:hypothetical protein